MSVGILPGMASYAGSPAATVDATTGAGVAVAPIGTTNLGAKLSLNFGADGGGTVAGTILTFAILYFGVMLAFHALDRNGL